MSKNENQEAMETPEQAAAPETPKTEYDYLESVNNRAKMARANEDRRAKAIAAAEQKVQAARQAKKRRRANMTFIVRVLAVVLLGVALWAAHLFDLIAGQLAFGVMCAGLTWLAFWAGAWVQFMWCKGGLLDGGTE